jgi:hypothetical protein
VVAKLLRALREPVAKISALFLSPYVWEVRFLENHHVIACSLRRALERRRRKMINSAKKRVIKTTTIAAIVPVDICPFDALEAAVGLLGSLLVAVELELESPAPTV